MKTRRTTNLSLCAPQGNQRRGVTTTQRTTTKLHEEQKQKLEKRKKKQEGKAKRDVQGKRRGNLFLCDCKYLLMFFLTTLIGMESSEIIFPLKGIRKGGGPPRAQ